MPFHPQGVLEHLDTPHEVELHILERPPLSLEQGYTRLRDMSIPTRKKDANVTHPHLSAFDLPLISVALVSAPFCLQKVEHAAQGKVLAILGWREREALPVLRLALLILLVLQAVRVLLLEAVWRA